MRKSRISQPRQIRLIEHFIAGTTARPAACLVGIHRNSAALYYHRLRVIIAKEPEVESNAMFDGEIEVDESCFGGRRKGKRGRRAAGKVPVFGLPMRGRKVYTRVIPDASGNTLVPIIKGKVMPDSIVYADSWRGYNALDVSSFRHYRINHSNVFAEARNHINGIENFRSQAKRHLRKFNGIPREHFGLFLKECERHFDQPDPKQQFLQLKQWVRKHMS